MMHNGLQATTMLTPCLALAPLDVCTAAPLEVRLLKHHLQPARNSVSFAGRTRHQNEFPSLRMPAEVIYTRDARCKAEMLSLCQ
jgi:hypothetical protein